VNQIDPQRAQGRASTIGAVTAWCEVATRLVVPHRRGHGLVV
jgi:hypothetical protein